MRRWLWFCILVLLVVRWHNWQVYPYTLGFDHSGHSQFLRLLALEGIVPHSQQVWSGYHPPFYYLLTTWVANSLGWLGPESLPRAGQLVSAVFSILAILMAYPTARRLVPGYEEYVVLLLAALPAELMLAAMVYNVTLGYFFTNLLLWLVVEAWRERDPVLWRELVMGVVTGLGMLSRPDCAVLPLILTALWIGRLVRDPSRYRDATLAYALGGFITTALMGWFMARNLSLYNRPFVFACDPDIFPYFYTNALITLPDFRTLSFYFHPSPTAWVEPLYPGAYPSFLGVTYASVWWDYFFSFFVERRIVLARFFLAAGASFTLFALAGLIDNLKRWPWWPVVANIGLTWFFYLAMSFNLPLDTAVKSTYIYTSFLASSLCFASACAKLNQRAQLVMGLWLGLFGLVTAWVFWL